MSCFLPKTRGGRCEQSTGGCHGRAARMHKAIAVIQFKLEGQTIHRATPRSAWTTGLLLDKIDFSGGTVRHHLEALYPLRDSDFPTIDPADPYALCPKPRPS